MNLLDGLKINNTILNTKGGKYYQSSFDANLDVFTMLSRNTQEEDIILKIENAINEDKYLALANILYLLDIRDGKGERRLFKIIFKHLCVKHEDLANKILPFIDKLGRYDYILLGIDTKLENQVIRIIKKQLESDKKTNNPSLLAKWLPSHRTHNKSNLLAKKVIKKLNITEKEYRKTLSDLRDKINIVEKNITEKKYDNIEFEKVPCKAMIKYEKLFNTKIENNFKIYKQNVIKGVCKINTKGLYAYEIISKILFNNNYDKELFNIMWDNQKNILKNSNENILVVADTSGSMLCNKGIPFSTSIGLAIYTAERNKGIFKDHFITFSSEPKLQHINGKTIFDKVHNIETIVDNTDIDKVFELILKTATENKVIEENMPSHIVIISDMEFDCGVYSKEGTNFQGWKKSFEEVGLKLPSVIFWNVAADIRGIPITKFDNDVAMISGFSSNVLENILELENITPKNVMVNKLDFYIELLKKQENV